jgi:hypothetical protein
MRDAKERIQAGGGPYSAAGGGPFAAPGGGPIAAPGGGTFSAALFVLVALAAVLLAALCGCATGKDEGRTQGQDSLQAYNDTLQRRPKGEAWEALSPASREAEEAERKSIQELCEQTQGIPLENFVEITGRYRSYLEAYPAAPRFPELNQAYEDVLIAVANHYGQVSGIASCDRSGLIFAVEDSSADLQTHMETMARDFNDAAEQGVPGRFECALDDGSLQALSISSPARPLELRAQKQSDRLSSLVYEDGAGLLFVFTDNRLDKVITLGLGEE